MLLIDIFQTHREVQRKACYRTLEPKLSRHIIRLVTMFSRTNRFTTDFCLRQSFSRTFSQSPKACSEGQPREHKISWNYIRRSPFFKSAVIVIFLSTAITHTIIQQKEVEETAGRYNNKTILLENVIEKLKNKQNVDIPKELRVVRSIFKHHRNTEGDSVLDEILKDETVAYFKTWNKDIVPSVAKSVVTSVEEANFLAEGFEDAEHVPGAFTNSASTKTVSKFL
ncbi:hypothetical protein BABINDRAFT_160746 [Babjeviella inositovora NRRL Y-12698]|uniref:Uncharacterized protein n=1 Tax=Babjeviella inositovora NRRL Y-12698 TaxID=984486 RepID=A0A1E3QSI4_9ASCO|nr:uncharacterized protein BABINDRAFT_160746 [Babjeviella inositovora NRRL Y-12698]ODQ80464.1 hypothetical protein BABINDRAFT_160746 [Babjeviella inositovora NRRL Y-12698]